MAPAGFAEETLKKIDEIMARYPTRRAAALPVLYLAQREFGCVDDRALGAASRVLGISKVEVYGLATYYSMFETKPFGRNVIHLCDNLACSLLGAESLQHHLERKLEIRMGETTQDGRFTLKNAECLGACAQAPVMLVNDDVYEGLTEARIDEILAKYE